ncbi:NrtA/SsuA/CpmA family ABC transporter substrate-binding protein [Peptoniphilus sp. KCTC 25270]|uniref:ABC transporter substrate-binding protein n=1 Tax=Peptoniphilus sp. KCTC 25270 TaxID=2897414 RepID=UPI001E41EDB3|nr:NrtA/SsuA/CpmA family ABC transporter substrate-binding protein [Peptoniphilus sp. KCTC 25270]MCD1147649.1 NrtA/SsuA/CpmA family ABC transporter substrate-binding protein [Peptoniphilus sp. KCTC 25270]
MKKLYSVLLCVLSLFVLVACGSGQENGENKEAVETNNNGAATEASGEKLSVDELTVTYVTSPLNVPSIVEKNKKIFEETMPGVKINYAEITSGAEQTQALASGDVQVLYALGGSSAILGKANGVDLKVLNMYSRGPEAFALYSTDEGITSPESLRGKKIAGPIGTNLHELLLAYLKSGNMTVDDVEYLDMSIPDALAALESGAVDGALLGGPAGYKALSAGKHQVVNGKGLIDAIICVAVSEEFYNEHPDVVEKLGEAQEKIQEYMDNNPEETKEIVMKELSIDEKSYEDMVKMYDFSTEIKDSDIEGFKRTADFMLETNMIEKELDVETLFVK